MRSSVMAALLCSVLLASSPASADPGFSSTSVNMRAGPGAAFPVLVVIPGAVTLDIVGCLSAFDWCDVSWGPNRGWVSGNYLRAQMRGRHVPLHQGPPPVIVFDFGGYWDAHYRDRPFYQHREQWRPGHQANTPSQRPTPAGQTGAPRGQAGNPAGQTGAPPGQAGNPAGQAGAPSQGGHGSSRGPCQPGTPNCR